MGILTKVVDSAETWTRPSWCTPMSTEGAEGGDVGDDALEDHARPEILHFLDAVGKGGGLEFRARVAAGFFQFLEDVLDGGQAEALVGVFGRDSP